MYGMKRTEREKKLLEKTIRQAKEVLDELCRDNLKSGDPLAHGEEIAQCMAIIKAIKYSLGEG